MRERLLESCKVHEGRNLDGNGEHLAYLDLDGRLTVGYGALLDLRFTISEHVAEELLAAELEEKRGRLVHHFYGFTEADEVRQDVILELAFWMGVGGLRGFPKFCRAVQAKDWRAAGAELRDSATWRRAATRPRMETLARRMETGTW